MIKELDNINEMINLHDHNKNVIIEDLIETMFSIDDERIISKIGFF